MTKIFKSSLICLIIVFAIATILPPVQVQALGKNPQCDAYQAKRDQVLQGIERKKPALDTLRVSNKFQMNQERNTTQQKNASLRAEQDKKRADLYKKLRAKAKTQTKTPEQKEAVEQYIQKIEAAVLQRRSSHDVRQSAFNKEFDTLVAAHRSSVNEGIVKLREAIAKSVTTSILDCEDRGADKVLKSVLTPSIAQADKAFVSTSVGDVDLKKSMKTLVDTRKSAMSAIDEDFKSSTTDARLVLKTALGNDVKYIIE